MQNRVRRHGTNVAHSPANHFMCALPGRWRSVTSSAPAPKPSASTCGDRRSRALATLENGIASVTYTCRVADVYVSRRWRMLRSPTPPGSAIPPCAAISAPDYFSSRLFQLPTKRCSCISQPKVGAGGRTRCARRCASPLGCDDRGSPGHYQTVWPPTSCSETCPPTFTFTSSTILDKGRRDQAHQRRCRDVARGCDRAGVVGAALLGTPLTFCPPLLIRVPRGEVVIARGTYGHRELHRPRPAHTCPAAKRHKAGAIAALHRKSPAPEPCSRAPITDQHQQSTGNLSKPRTDRVGLQ
jgi:hypothetical protein